MSEKPSGRIKRKNLISQADSTASENKDAMIERLQADLTRYRTTLEEIRDQTFEQANSQRLIDQLWHFVRWTKATARNALEQSEKKTKK